MRTRNSKVQNSKENILRHYYSLPDDDEISENEADEGAALELEKINDYDDHEHFVCNEKNTIAITLTNTRAIVLSRTIAKTMMTAKVNVMKYGAPKQRC